MYVCVFCRICFHIRTNVLCRMFFQRSMHGCTIDRPHHVQHILLDFKCMGMPVSIRGDGVQHRSSMSESHASQFNQHEHFWQFSILSPVCCSGTPSIHISLQECSEILGNSFEGAKIARWFNSGSIAAGMYNSVPCDWYMLFFANSMQRFSRTLVGRSEWSGQMCKKKIWTLLFLTPSWLVHACAFMCMRLHMHMR